MCELSSLGVLTLKCEAWVVNMQASFDPPGLSIAVKKDRAVETLLVMGNKFNVNVLAQGNEKVCFLCIKTLQSFCLRQTLVTAKHCSVTCMRLWQKEPGATVRCRWCKSSIHIGVGKTAACCCCDSKFGHFQTHCMTWPGIV